MPEVTRAEINAVKQIIVRLGSDRNSAALLEINRYIIDVSRGASRQATRTFHRGQRVKWISKKHGNVVKYGEVSEIKQKNIVVDETGTRTRWTVPAIVLEPV
jgi:hypothetical protein